MNESWMPLEINLKGRMSVQDETAPSNRESYLSKVL